MDLEKIKKWVKRKVLIWMGIFLLVLYWAHVKNEEMNNYSYCDEYRCTFVYSTFITGHSEFTNWKNGMTELKIYPGFGHRWFDSLHYIDYDGDGKVDKIRQNGSELKMNRLEKLLLRVFHYSKYPHDFDGADREIARHLEKYDKKIRDWREKTIKPG